MVVGAGASLALGCGEPRTVEAPPNLTIEAPAAVQESIGSIPVSESVTVETLPPLEIVMPAEASVPAVRLAPPESTLSLEEQQALYVTHYPTWLKIAQCESGSDWAINTGNGFYGGLQFLLSTWRINGGLNYAPRPNEATPLEQMLVAEVVHDQVGFSAWPGCARKLGLI